MSDKQIWQLDAVQLSALLAAGVLTPIDLFEAFLDRFDRLNGALNAFAFLDREGGRRAAEASHVRHRKRERLGRLDGIPISVKDNLYVAGLPAEWGSRLFRGHVPEHDDLCVERLRAAGAVIVGKSATAEFALSGRTETRVLGTTRNPWNPALTPGGSSGGAVAAVAAGIIPLAIGTDAGGSIRLPASYTGLVGLRPSNGRIPRRYGFPPMALDFQAIGLTARTVGDLELLFTTLAGPDRRDPVSLSASSSGSPARPLRIGWFAQLGDDRPDEAVRASHEQAVGVLSRLGHRVEPCAPPFEVARLKQIWETLSSVGAARVALRFPNWEAEVTKPLAAIVERGRQRSAREYVEALDMLHEFRAETYANWREYDALVLPTGAAPAWPTDLEHPAVIGGKPGNGAIQSMFCGWVNAAGFTGLSVPADPHVDGRPIGVQFVARAGGDEMLLSLARDFEAAAPWAERWPELAGAEA
ncbi:MAG TPA: amidase [Chthoniobacterales bacterium]